MDKNRTDSDVIELEIGAKCFKLPKAVSKDNIDLKDHPWVMDIYDEVIKKFTNSGEVWDFLFNTLFEVEELTDTHKCLICILFASRITDMMNKVEMQEMMQTFDSVLGMMKDNSQGVIRSLI